MRRQPMCGPLPLEHHQACDPRTPRCMPARRSSPKPPKAADAKGELVAQGFRVADSGPHTSKTLMLQELEALLASVPPDAPAKAYRVAIVEENVLGKRTLSTLKETASRLTALHGLDPTKPLFRVMQRLLGVDPTAHPKLALLGGLACKAPAFHPKVQRLRARPRPSQPPCAWRRVWDLLPASAVKPTREEEG